MSARSESGALPNLIVIGSQKCGTSGLHHYLGLHPETSMSAPKELDFFVAERNHPQGLGWYRGHFDTQAKVRGESSPNYTAFPQHVGVPERMHSTVPEVRLVYMVRDPIDRIAAHWVHNFAKRREKGDLSATLMHRNTSYLARSHYYTQLRQFLRLYPAERILVVEQEGLRNRRLETLRRVFEFVGVDPGFSHPSFDERHCTGPPARRGRPGWRCHSNGSGRRIAAGWSLGTVLASGRQPLPLPSHDQAPGRSRGAVAGGSAVSSRGRRATPRAHRARVRDLVDLPGLT